MTNELKELKFTKIGSAKKLQRDMRKMYGYTPSIFTVAKDNKFLYHSIVKPSGLRRVDKR